MKKLNVVYLDDDFVAVNKPPGMIVHHAPHSRDGQPALLQLLRDQLGCRLYPVHRLDQPTSGIVLFGLRSDSAAALVDLLTHQRIHKCYQAIVRGWMHHDSQLDIPLSKPTTDGTIPMYQRARTLIHVIRWYQVHDSQLDPSCQKISWIEAVPKTGRLHQIRRHLKHIAHPIFGDYRHGDPRCNDWLKKSLTSLARSSGKEAEGRLTRDSHPLADTDPSFDFFEAMMLSAVRVDFVHPFTRQQITIRSPKHDAFILTLEYLEPFTTPMLPAKLPPQPESQKLNSANAYES